jgi:hypothetical protein
MSRSAAPPPRFVAKPASGREAGNPEDNVYKSPSKSKPEIFHSVAVVSGSTMQLAAMGEYVKQPERHALVGEYYKKTGAATVLYFHPQRKRWYIGSDFDETSTAVLYAIDSAASPEAIKASEWKAWSTSNSWESDAVHITVTKTLLEEPAVAPGSSTKRGLQGGTPKKSKCDKIKGRGKGRAGNKRQKVDVKQEVMAPKVDVLKAGLCSFCEGDAYDNSNKIVFCEVCAVGVHQLCYGVKTVPDGPWMCDLCARHNRSGSVSGKVVRVGNVSDVSTSGKGGDASTGGTFTYGGKGGKGKGGKGKGGKGRRPPQTSVVAGWFGGKVPPGGGGDAGDGGDISATAAPTAPPRGPSPSERQQCALCLQVGLEYGGAFKRAQTGSWCHLVCAYWTPEMFALDKPLLQGHDAARAAERCEKTCGVCGVHGGVPVYCASGKCMEVIHVVCARDRGLKMVQDMKKDKLTLKVFCTKHSGQKEKKRKEKKEKGEGQQKTKGQQKNTKKGKVEELQVAIEFADVDASACTAVQLESSADFWRLFDSVGTAHFSEEPGANEVTDGYTRIRCEALDAFTKGELYALRAGMGVGTINIESGTSDGASGKLLPAFYIAKRINGNIDDVDCGSGGSPAETVWVHPQLRRRGFGAKLVRDAGMGPR